MRSKKSSPSFEKQNSRYCPTPIAVIDVGTNTIRLLIGCISGGEMIRIVSDRAVTRLGKDILKTGRLDQNSIEKSIASIIKFKGLCEKYNVRKTTAIGTSALREAKNSNEFLEDVKKTTGLDIEIISGEKEAELTLKGIMGDAALFESSVSKASIIVDIGGGSTEWIFFNNSKFKIQNSKLRMGSIPIGAVKLFETFIKHDPPAHNELQKTKEYIAEKILGSLDTSPITHPMPLSLIVTGGTATTIATLDMGLDKYDGDKIHRHKISLPPLKAIYEKLIGVPVDKRSKIKGLEMQRADIIIPGILILLTLMQILNLKEVIISDYGLLEGAIISYHVL